MDNIDEVIYECREKLRQSATCEGLVIYLHDRKINIIDSMKIIREVCRIPLGQAKTIVTSHPIWRVEVQNADVLHEELVNSFSKQEP